VININNTKEEEIYRYYQKSSGATRNKTMAESASFVSSFQAYSLPIETACKNRRGFAFDGPFVIFTLSFKGDNFLQEQSPQVIQEKYR
jgi:hypothetical protein